MVLELIKRHFPHIHGVESAQWFIDLRILHERQRRRMILIGFLSGIVTAVGFLIVDLISGNAGLPFLYYSAMVVLIAILMVSAWFYRHLPELSTVVLILGIIGFLSGIFLPGGRHVYILSFFTFPVLALSLKPIRQALYWILIMLALAFGVSTILTVFDPASILPSFRMDQSIMGLAAYALTTAITVSVVSQQNRYLERIVREFCYDDISGRPTRRILEHSVLPENSYVFGIARIENFSELHAVFGQDFSERLLQRFASHMEDIPVDWRPNLFKLQFPEFGILVPTIILNAMIGKEILRTLVEHASRLVIVHDNIDVRLDVRIGGTLIHRSNSTPFLEQADLALQQCLLSRRSHGLYSDETILRTEPMGRISAFGELVKNLEDNSLEVLYQPLVDADSHETVLYECLLRIRDSEGALQTPGPYLAVAEKIGLMETLTEFVLERAIQTIVDLGIKVSINITQNDMLSPSFLDAVRAAMSRIHAGAGGLVLEIVEADELTEVEAGIRFIRVVRSLGCEVALDDFGSGYANFSNLLRLPLDYLKIDGTLIRQVAHDDKVRSFLDGVIAICRRNDIQVVAEFVDSAATADILRQSGVDILQGFFFGKPARLPGKSLLDPADSPQPRQLP